MQVFENRKGRRLYHIESEIEVGIALVGSEVKAIRLGRVDLTSAYAIIEEGKVILKDMFIGHYEKAGHFAHDIRRPRHLLMHKDEIKKIKGKIKEKGYTLIPLKLYFNNKGLAKILLGIARGKKKIERREDDKARDEEREIEKLIKKEMEH
ncbi:MAG: SsrA-binding protein SmpB [bacterium]